MSNSPQLPEQTESAENTPQKEADGLRSHLVPYEERASQHPKFATYLKNTLTIFGYIALGAITGGLIGRGLESRNIGLGPFQRYGETFGGSSRMDARVGMWAGVKVGTFVGLYRHWKHSEGKRLGVKEISGDLMPSMDAVQLAQEVKQEQAILDDLRVVQEKLDQSGISHAQRETTRRATPNQQGMHV